MQAWLRIGLLAGAVSATATLLLGLLRAAVKSDYCQAGIIGVGHPSAVDVALNLSGLALLLLLAGAAGRQTVNACEQGQSWAGWPCNRGDLGLRNAGAQSPSVRPVHRLYGPRGRSGLRYEHASRPSDMAVVAIAIGAGLAVIAASVGAAITRRA